jgi:hypothetical protein
VGSDVWANHFGGDIAEIILYDRKISQSEIDGVEGYLSAKYGLVIPEPATIYLLGIGALSLIKKKKGKIKSESALKSSKRTKQHLILAQKQAQTS